MKIDGKIRTSVWVHPSFILLLNERGLTLSSFLSLALPMFLELPPDPREQLIKADVEKMVLRLRSTYELEIKQIMQEKAEKDAELIPEKQRISELIQFGDYLQRTKSYPDFRRCLERKDPDDSVLRNITKEINRLNGNEYEEIELWNKAITWYAVAKKREAVHG